MNRHQVSKTQQRLHFKIYLSLIALIPLTSNDSTASNMPREKMTVEDSSEKKPVPTIRIVLDKSPNVYQNKPPSFESRFKNQSNFLKIPQKYGKDNNAKAEYPSKSIRTSNNDMDGSITLPINTVQICREKIAKSRTMTHSYSAVFPSISSRTSIDVSAPSKALPIIYELDEEQDNGTPSTTLTPILEWTEDEDTGE